MKTLILAVVAALSISSFAQLSADSFDTGAPFDIVISLETGTNVLSNYSDQDWYQINEYYLSELQVGLDVFITDYLAAGFNVGYMYIFDFEQEFASSSVSLKAQMPAQKLQPYVELDAGIIWVPYLEQWLTPNLARFSLSPGIQFNTASGIRYSLGLKYDHYVGYELNNFEYFEGLAGVRAGILF